MTPGEPARSERDELLHQMGERIKELRCMYGVAESIRNSSSLEELFNTIVKLIPPGWHYPDITRGQIYFDGEPYRSHDFEPTSWRQVANIEVNGLFRGSVEVFYLEERPPLDEGPFLNEERYLLDAIASMLGSTIERLEAEAALQTSEQRYLSLFTRSNDAIVIYNLSGDLLEANTSACQLLGYRQEELESMTLLMLHPESELSRVIRSFREIARKGQLLFESRLVTADMEHLEVEISSSLIDQQKELVLGIIRDVTEKKRAEEELKRRLMRFRIEDGSLYLVQERAPHLSVEAFQDLINVGYPGLIISRTPEREMRHRMEVETEYWWVAEKAGEAALQPILEEIEQRIEDWPVRSVILIDRLDYLLTRHGFPELLLFVQHLRDHAYIIGHIIILSLDPQVLTRSELSLLEKEVREIEPQVQAKLTKAQIELLRYVYRQNTMGVTPSYSELSRDLATSRPTIRKRVQHLEYLDYLKETLKGKRKNLELTEKGLDLFIK